MTRWQDTNARTGTVSTYYGIGIDQAGLDFVDVDVSADTALFLDPRAIRTLDSEWGASCVVMRPDLVIRAGGRDLAVGDAKYKELAPRDWPHADLYQLLAYCDALRLSHGLLIYADSRRSRTELVEGTNVVLEIVGIDLTGDHRGVLARAQAAALKLVAQARLHEDATFQLG